MRLAVLAFALAVAACASTDPAADYARFKSEVNVRTNQQGWPVASSAPSTEAKNANLYAGGETLAMWVLVLQPPQGVATVVLAGSRARAIPQADVKPTDEQGPWDRPEPAHVGNPWREADFAFTQRRTECYGEAFWCNRLQQFSVTLAPDMVKAFIAEDAPDSIPVALFTRRDVDWRISRAELLATLDAAGATAGFR
jgi:hypothetical protein